MVYKPSCKSRTSSRASVLFRRSKGTAVQISQVAVECLVGHVQSAKQMLTMLVRVKKIVLIFMVGTVV